MHANCILSHMFDTQCIPGIWPLSERVVHDDAKSLVIWFIVMYLFVLCLDM